MDERETQVLLVNECWQLLRDAEVGRLAVVVDAAPEIFPVNFVVDHGTVVFRTAEGSKLAALVNAANVAFEIDGWTDGDAFSVVVKGRGKQIGNRDELFAALELPLFPWHAAPKHHFVRIEPEIVSGRRFHVHDRRDHHSGDPAPARRSAPE
jgi:nitroimidazol reductase NimA-like FMN-containing flavoprotein (pyridoxamine 5'-phosphate oxidase superfamily)